MGGSKYQRVVDLIDLISILLGDIASVKDRFTNYWSISGMAAYVMLEE